VRVLLLVSAFNGLTQRLQRELTLLDHDVAVEIAGSAASMEDAVALFRPDLIVCPYLRQRVPDSIWKRHHCLIVHPGTQADRGTSSLDWAIKRADLEWGVTLLQAAEELNAGPSWGSANFRLREAAKGSIYRREVSEMAVRLVLSALERVGDKQFKPQQLNEDHPNVTGRLNRTMKQADRRIDWLEHSTDEIVRRINAADGSPGVLDEIDGQPVYLYDASRAIDIDMEGRAGALLAQSHGAICRATRDGAVWIGHVKRAMLGPQRALKLPATTVLGSCRDLPSIEADGIGAPAIGRNEIRYYEIGEVGYLHFDFYNGAMNTQQCRRLQRMLQQAKQRPTKVIALLGGDEFFSNGIHLNCIEAASNPADESWANTHAMNDVVKEVLEADKHLTVALVRGNARAGGAVLAAACDQVWIRSGVVLNVHYRTMGLYGSEYWTYALPKRVGAAMTERLITDCLPTLAKEALDIKLADRVLTEQWENYEREADRLLGELTEPSEYKKLMAAKQKTRERDARRKPLQSYRDAELHEMHRIFYDPRSDYHQARHHFVHKVQPDATPLRIAPHRATSMQRRA
jgi:putative two-component system hydrogenase maturation factor HypX/HoxX